MKEGETCTAQWKTIRNVLHPAQEAVGFAAVQRKLKKDYKTEKKARNRMNEPGSILPFVLGPNGIPYLIDSHHTTSALEASGHFDVKVSLKKVCDWSSMSQETFYQRMKQENFMNAVGRMDGDPNTLPTPLENVDMAIPSTIADLKDDPWRSFGALVRKAKNDQCPVDNQECLRGYLRECKDDGRMTAFFEFRWAYFMNDAFNKGCENKETSYWDDLSDCQRFERAYKALREKDNGQGILNQDGKAWNEAAKLLVPLCRGKVAGEYKLPETLGNPMGGERLPGCVTGKDTQIDEKDPKCKAPACPKLPEFLSAQCVNTKGE
jgi:hypothetical protein